MEEPLNIKNLPEKIVNFDSVEILVNNNQEMLFEGIIDAPYISMHFERIVNAAKDFDIVRMVGYHGRRSKETIAEVIVSK